MAQIAVIAVRGPRRVGAAAGAIIVMNRGTIAVVGMLSSHRSDRLLPARGVIAEGHDGARRLQRQPQHEEHSDQSAK